MCLHLRENFFYAIGGCHLFFSLTRFGFCWTVEEETHLPNPSHSLAVSVNVNNPPSSKLKSHHVFTSENPHHPTNTTALQARPPQT